jgi:multifunctional beta-oxidation protein
LTPEAIASKWKQITDFSGKTTHPESPAEATSMLMQGAVAQRPAKPGSAKGASGNKVLEKAQSVKVSPGEYKYDNQEGSYLEIIFLSVVILYNLGLGAKRRDLNWVFEGASGFEVLPTFGVVPQFDTQMGFPLAEILPNFSPVCFRPWQH